MIQFQIFKPIDQYLCNFFRETVNQFILFLVFNPGRVEEFTENQVSWQHFCLSVNSIILLQFTQVLHVLFKRRSLFCKGVKNIHDKGFVYELETINCNDYDLPLKNILDTTHWCHRLFMLCKLKCFPSNTSCGNNIYKVQNCTSQGKYNHPHWKDHDEEIVHEHSVRVCRFGHIYQVVNV